MISGGQVHKIYVTGEITDESFHLFSKSISKIERMRDGEKVLVEIISEGGSATAALAYYDRIDKSQLIFIGKATGLVASAASLIFMACDQRRMTENAWLMVHEDSTTDEESKPIHAREKEIAHSRRLEKQWCTLMAGCSTISLSKWEELHKNETYLSRADCMELGILDE